MDAQIPTITGPASLDDIAREYGKLVSSLCRRMIRDEEVAKEAAQQGGKENELDRPTFPEAFTAAVRSPLLFRLTHRRI